MATLLEKKKETKTHDSGDNFAVLNTEKKISAHNFLCLNYAIRDIKIKNITMEGKSNFL